MSGQAKSASLGSRLILFGLLALLGLFLAMVAAPWVFRLTQSLDLTADYPFRRVFNRVVLASEILCFACAFKKLGISAPWKVYFKWQHVRKEFFPWLVIAILTMGFLTLMQWLAGFRIYTDRSFGYILEKGLKALFSALCVAFLEETIFRGLLFTAVRERFKSFCATIIASAIFAGLHIFSLDHFLQGIKRATATFSGTDPLAGFYHMGLFLEPLKDLHVVVPGFVGLFICSLMLCALTLRTGSLWSAIAQHAGWVFTIKITGRIWRYDEALASASGWQWLLGEKFVATSVLGWIVVLIEIGYVLGIYAYLVYRLMQWACDRLPLNFCFGLANKIGSLMFLLGFGKKKVALDNLRHAFPEKSEEERTEIARKSFQNLARVAFSTLLMPRLAKRVPSGLTGRHPDRLAKAHREGPGGVVFFTAHFGNWECQSWTSTLMGADFTAVGRPFRNRRIYEHIVKHREEGGVKLVDKKDALRPLVKALRRGGEIGLVADQYAGSEGVPTIFFGRVCSTTGAPAMLARLTGCPLLPSFCRNLPGNRFEAYVYEPIYVEKTDNAEEDIRKATQLCMDCLEREIRLQPECYLWAHRKWRSSYSEKHADLEKKGL